MASIAILYFPYKVLGIVQGERTQSYLDSVSREEDLPWEGDMREKRKELVSC